MLVDDSVFGCFSYTYLPLFVFLVHSGSTYINQVLPIPDSEFRERGYQ